MASYVIGGSPVASSPPASAVLTPKNIYSTLTKVRTYLSLASQNTDNDDVLKEFLRSSSRAIDRYCDRFFYPQSSQLKFDLPEDGRTLRFEDFDVLEIRGLSDMNGASEIDNSVYWGKTGVTWNFSPYDRLIIDDSSGSIFKYIRTPIRSIHMDAIIGFHDDYNNAWINSGASLTQPIDNQSHTIYLSGSLGEDTQGNKPRVEEGYILKVDEEFMLASSGLSSSQIRIIRGINGTTASAHSTSATIYIWRSVDEIEYATRRLAAYQFQQSIAPYTGRQITLGFGAVIETPEEWPIDIQNKLDRYKKRRIYAIGKRN